MCNPHLIYKPKICAIKPITVRRIYIKAEDFIFARNIL